MHVSLYDSTQYTSGISVQDKTLYGHQGAYSVQTITVDDITYSYVHDMRVDDSVGVAGSIICNAVTDPVENKIYYIKSGKSAKFSASIETVTPDEYWRVKLSMEIKLGNGTICSYSVTNGVNDNPSNHPEYFDIRFCSVILDNKLFYGFCFYATPETSVFCCLVSENFFTDSLTEPYQDGASGADPDSGFGDNDTASDTITKIGSIAGIIAAPSAHGLHIYEMNGTAYADFMNKLLSKQLSISAVRSFLSVEDSLISLHLLPQVDRNQTTETAVNVGGLFAIPVSGSLKADTAGSNVRTVPSGYVSVGTIANDFLDYTNTSAVLYLPFCGTVPIDIQDIMDGGIEIIYEIDILQGNCVANVYTTNHQGREKLQGCYAGNCAYRLPITGNKDGSGVIAGLVQTFVGAAAGSASTALQGMYGALSAGVGSGTYAQGSIAGNSAYYSDTTCYLMLYRPNAVYPAQYGRQLGRPSGSSSIVGNYSGFVSGYVHADISGATDAEKQAIESWIERGIVV